MPAAPRDAARRLPARGLREFRFEGIHVTEPIELKVSLGYSVWVGAGLLDRAAELIPFQPERIALVSEAPVYAVHGQRARLGLSKDAAVLLVEPGGEDAKTMSAAESLARELARSGLHRNDAIAALGGGAIGDLAGFVAGTYHRGIAFVPMPTTLLSQVDASIGGKTAVNLPEGKNLVGVFHQPAVVIADVTTLATLPAGEFNSGMAEVIKHGLIADPGLLDAMKALDELDEEVLTKIVARAAAVKIAVVEEDATEQGSRAFLNYGHTLGHALESLGLAGKAPRRRHGEAVAIGMMFAARLAARLGFADTVAIHRGAIERAGLPTSGAGVPVEVVMEAMQADKKFDHGLRFVLLEDLGRPALVSDIDDAQLRAAYAEVE